MIIIKVDENTTLNPSIAADQGTIVDELCKPGVIESLYATRQEKALSLVVKMLPYELANRIYERIDTVEADPSTQLSRGPQEPRWKQQLRLALTVPAQ